MLGELKKDVLSFERIYLDSMNRWHDSFTTVGGELCPLMCSRCSPPHWGLDNYATFAMPLRGVLDPQNEAGQLLSAKLRSVQRGTLPLPCPCGGAGAAGAGAGAASNIATTLAGVKAGQ